VKYIEQLGLVKRVCQEAELAFLDAHPIRFCHHIAAHGERLLRQDDAE